MVYMNLNTNLCASTPCKVNPGNFNFLKKLKLPGLTLHGEYALVELYLFVKDFDKK